MKTSMTLRNSLVAASIALALGATASSANAQTIPTANLFTGATATGVAQYPGDTDPATRANLAIDGTANGLVFADSPTATGDLNISNLTLSSDITSFMIYSGSGSGRESGLVTIYYSTSNSAAIPTQDDLNANFDGGLSYALSYTGTTGYYDQLPGNGSPVSFATITGIDIPSDTKSVFFQFQNTGGQYGAQVDEIQAFGPVVETPEPSTWAMMLGGLATLGFIARRRSVA